MLLPLSTGHDERPDAIHQVWRSGRETVARFFRLRGPLLHTLKLFQPRLPSRYSRLLSRYCKCCGTVYRTNLVNNSSVRHKTIFAMCRCRREAWTSGREHCLSPLVLVLELERIYVEFQKVLLLPWRSANSNRSAKFQSHWDVRLEALPKEKDKIFRKLKKSRHDCRELWSTFHALDKQIKRSVRNKKKGIRRQ